MSMMSQPLADSIELTCKEEKVSPTIIKALLCEALEEFVGTHLQSLAKEQRELACQLSGVHELLVVACGKHMLPVQTSPEMASPPTPSLRHRFDTSPCRRQLQKKPANSSPSKGTVPPSPDSIPVRANSRERLAAAQKKSGWRSENDRERKSQSPERRDSPLDGAAVSLPIVPRAISDFSLPEAAAFDEASVSPKTTGSRSKDSDGDKTVSTQSLALRTSRRVSINSALSQDLQDSKRLANLGDLEQLNMCLVLSAIKRKSGVARDGSSPDRIPSKGLAFEYGRDSTQSFKSVMTVESSDSCLTKSTNGHRESTAPAHSRLDRLRAEKEEEIMCSIEVLDEPVQSLLHRLHGLPSGVMCIFGVVPFDKGLMSSLYAAFVLLLITCVILLSIALAVEDNRSVLSTHLCTMCYALGAALGLCGLWANKVQDLVGPGAHLEMYARSRGYLQEWLDKSTHHLVLVLLLWFAAGLARVLSVLEHPMPGEEDAAQHSDSVMWLSLISFLLVSGIFVGLSFCQLHVCLGLEVMIDDFSISFFMENDIKHALIQWNILQALLRRSSRVIEFCMLALQTSVLATLVLTGFEMLDNKGPLAEGGTRALLWCASLSLPVAISLYVLLRAAAVTEKCSRVPSLVNSIAMDCQSEELDHSCFALVDYVTNSAAGFYVKGVRLTAFMVLKLSYLLGIALFTIVSRSIRQAQG